MTDATTISNRKGLVDPVLGDLSCAISMAGSRYWLEVGEVMTEDVAVALPDQPVVSAAQQMSQMNISCVVIVENDQVIGIVTETDLLKRAVVSGKHVQSLTVREIMSGPVLSVGPHLSVLAAARMMEQSRIKRLVILSEGRLVGIVTQTDLVRVLTSYGMWKDISAIMSRQVATIPISSTVAQAARIMAGQDISCVVALDGQKIAGVFTERDLMKRVIALKRDPDKTPLDKVLSSPVVSVTPSTSVLGAFKVMEKHKIRRLAVVENDTLFGIVTQTDVFYAIKGKLQEEEHKNIRMLEESHNSIFAADLDGVVVYANPAFLRLMEGRSLQEFVGQPFLPESFWLDPSERKPVLEALCCGQVDIRELALRGCQGRKIFATLFTTFTKNINGQINGAMGLLDDITDKKELVALRDLQNNLRHSEQMLRATIESTADGILVIDETGRISHWNRRFARMWGLSEDQIVRMDGTALLDSLAGRLKRPKKFQNVIRQLGRWKQDSLDTPRLRDGKTIESYTCPLHRDGDPGGRVWNFRDITWRKRAEDELVLAQSEAQEACRSAEQVNRQLAEAVERANIMAQEAVAASRAKGEFLANMSHEIRTPMNAILGFAELLASERLTERQQEFLKTIGDSGRHLLSIIEDILDFSKIEAGRLQTEMREFSLGDLLGGVERLMRPLAERKSIRLILEIEPKPGIKIHSDEARIRQCLINLVSNAIKFTETGQIVVRTRIETEGPSRSKVRFEVQDTGIGISADQMKYLFEPFRQGDGSTTRLFGGTGLGLAITRQLAELLGGRVSVTSEVGAGSTFVLELPVECRGSDESPAPQTKPLDSRSRPSKSVPLRLSGQVLVVEDSANNRMLMKILLEKFGLQVTLASDGVQGLQMAQSRSFDLILMDIQMPKMTGYEVVQALRGQGLRTPIVALTAHAMKDDHQRCLEVGCDLVLTKPLDRARFKQMLLRFLVPGETAGPTIVGRLHSVPESVGRRDNPKEAQGT
jgi:PAS domain S-box-containing protein